jgi:uncharacterized protein (DUF2236 family)
MPHDREALERQLKTLEKRLKLLADDDAIREIILEHLWKNGWTTLAEHRLVLATARALDQQARTMIQLKQEMLEAAREITAAGELPQAA